MRKRSATCGMYDYYRWAILHIMIFFRHRVVCLAKAIVTIMCSKPIDTCEHFHREILWEDLWYFFKIH